MADIREWLKGITFFVFVTLMFYWLWGNVFSNIIEFIGTDIFSIGDATSVAIMKTMAWVSFIFLYLSVGGIYLIYSIMMGASGKVETQPLWFLVAVGTWSVLMPFLTFIYGMVYYMQTSLETATTGLMDTTSVTTASTFSWILALIVLIALVVIPFTFVLKGYGVNLMGTKGEKDE